MPSSAAKKLVRQFYFELFRDLAAALECVGSTLFGSQQRASRAWPGDSSCSFAAMRQAFPDFSMKIEDMIAEGDRVVTRVTGKGTHTGMWMQTEPTGSLVEVKGINIDRIVDRRIVEHWGEARHRWHADANGR